MKAATAPPVKFTTELLDWVGFATLVAVMVTVSGETAAGAV
jgi:hypothetical protein